MKVGSFAVKSDPGRRRRRNEDSYVVEPPLFAVADGMGGAQAGEVASRLAAGVLKEGGEGGVEELIQEANRRVHQRSLEDPNASGMGTTVTVALVEDDHVRIGHVGDSRAYLIRGGQLEQLTQDHSLVGELVRSGKLAREEAESHPQRSVITRAVGTDPDVDVDSFVIEPREGDLFLLCSDGLTDMVADTAIEQLAQQQRENLDELVKGLVKAANRGGGEDNITVVAFEIANGADDLEQTAVVPAAAVAEPQEEDDEDTLTEADGVPVVDTMVVSADELAAAYEREAAEPPPPRPRRLRRFLRRLFAYLVVLALLAGLAALILWGLSR